MNEPAQDRADPRQLLLLAQDQERRGDLRGAFMTCQTCLFDHPDGLPAELMAELYLTMARISLGQGRNERAENYTNKAANLWADLPGLAELRAELSPVERAEPPNPPIAEPSDPRPPPKVPRSAVAEAAPPEKPRLPRAVPRDRSAETAQATPPDATESPEGLWLADFWVRTLAALVDFTALLGILIATTSLSILALGLEREQVAEAFGGGLLNIVLVGLMFLFVFLLYQAVFVRFGGQTLGKMLLGIRVVELDGCSPSTSASLRRALGVGLASLPLFAGLLWTAFDLNRRGWHDKLGGTVVIRTRPVERKAGESLAPTAPGEPGSR